MPNDGRFTQVPEWVQDRIQAHPSGTSRTLHVYIAVARHRDYGKATGACPGRQKIADAVGCSVSTVKRHLRRLWDLGVAGWTTGTSGWNTNEYVLPLKPPEEDDWNIGLPFDRAEKDEADEPALPDPDDVVTLYDSDAASPISGPADSQDDAMGWDDEYEIEVEILDLARRLVPKGREFLIQYCVGWGPAADGIDRDHVARTSPLQRLGSDDTYEARPHGWEWEERLSDEVPRLSDDGCDEIRAAARRLFDLQAMDERNESLRKVN